MQQAFPELLQSQEQVALPAPFAKKVPTCRGSYDPPPRTAPQGGDSLPSPRQHTAKYMLKMMGWKQGSSASLSQGNHAEAFQRLFGALPVALLRSTHAMYPAPQDPAGAVTRRIQLEPLQGSIWPWGEGWGRIKQHERGHSTKRVQEVWTVLSGTWYDSW